MYKAAALNNLGMIDYKKGNLRSAKNYFMRSLNIYKNELNDSNTKESDPLVNIANVYLKEKDYSNARKFYYYAYKIHKNKNAYEKQLKKIDANVLVNNKK